MKPKEKKQIIADKELVAYCGLYCGACGAYLKGRCPGCRENTKAAWCTIRQCCRENNFLSCADCKIVELKDCRKYNTFISKLIGIVLNSDRAACISRIKATGYEGFALEMTQLGRQTIRRS